MLICGFSKMAAKKLNDAQTQEDSGNEPLLPVEELEPINLGNLASNFFIFGILPASTVIGLVLLSLAYKPICLFQKHLGPTHYVKNINKTHFYLTGIRTTSC